MSDLLDRYWVLARLFPATLTSIPAIALWFYLKVEGLATGFISHLEGVVILESIGLYIILLFLLSIIVQNTSKLFQKWYFEWHRGLPTTYLMTFEDDTFSDHYKKTYRRLVRQEFGLELPETDEAFSQEEIRQLLREAADQVRLFVGKGQLVHDKNIIYGFVRNLTGGSAIATLLCVANLILAIFFLDNSDLSLVSTVLLVPYLIYLLGHKPLLILTAESYARQLIGEFIAMASPEG